MLHLFCDDGQTIGQCLTTNIAGFFNHCHFASCCLYLGEYKDYRMQSLIYSDIAPQGVREYFSHLESAG